MLQRSLLQRRLLQKITEITYYIKDIIQAVTEESPCADHAIFEICMTRTANEASLGIYTLEEEQKIGGRQTTRNPQKVRLPFHYREETSQNYYSIIFRY